MEALQKQQELLRQQNEELRLRAGEYRDMWITAKKGFDYCEHILRQHNDKLGALNAEVENRIKREQVLTGEIGALKGIISDLRAELVVKTAKPPVEVDKTEPVVDSPDIIEIAEGTTD